MMEASNTQTNQNQENDSISDHVISFPDAEQEWLASVEDKIKVLPKLLKKSAGKKACCIFRVPQSLAEINERAYQPQILSIGPYHHGQPHLKMIQEQKYRFLGAVLARTQCHGISLNDFHRTIASLEDKIRECYSETIQYCSHEFIEMMILDGCFIIELFCMVGDFVRTDPDDPIFNMEWIFVFLMRDLLRLENQIPFFVLQSLFALSLLSIDLEKKVPTLTDLALNFFNYAAQRSIEYLDKYKYSEGKHLLDLYRQALIPKAPEFPRMHNLQLELIRSASKLHAAGIHFEPSLNESFLAIKFNNGVLEIPPLSIDDFTSSVILNCVAFEQSYFHCEKYFTSYVTFMGCLINSPADVSFLCDHQIIHNNLGTDEAVARFFSDVGQDITFDITKSYLAQVFEDVSRHYSNKWLVRWAGFKDTYFGSPWSFMSAVAAVLLLLPTVIQSFVAVYQYAHPSKS